MEIQLIEIIKTALIGKKIKLYGVKNKAHGNLFYFAHKNGLTTLPYPERCEIIGETHGTIKNIEASSDPYEGDDYFFHVVDDNGDNLQINGLTSITNIIEIIE